MSGIYIHIPFCKQACHYCDFHFSTSLNTKAAFLEALKKEIDLRAGYLSNDLIETIYFGGGTPSLLSGAELESIFALLQSRFTIAPDAEITLEANPDDLSHARLEELSASRVNRLSIGIQSFREADLKRMNRAHTAIEAEVCVKRAREYGFANISIDLIYGLPEMSDQDWRTNLHRAFELKVEHISSYCLTVEPKTAWAKYVQSGKVLAVSDEQSASHFRILKEEMGWNNFIQYEISNFGLEGSFSKHNSNYWKGAHYLGLGPSAHSYNGLSRQWNVSNNAKYIKSLQENTFKAEVEVLTVEQKYNEYVMTSLRTIWGCNLKLVQDRFGEKLSLYCAEEAEFYIHSGSLVYRNHTLMLSDEGMLLADRIAADLFYVS
jgi:oxygen-independent coproporphyrinogen-3 oxidase